MTKQIAHQSFDENLRAESILHLGLMCTDPISDALKNAIDDDYERIWEAIGTAHPDDDSQEGIQQHLYHHNKFGFLIQVSTPIPRNMEKHDEYGGYSYSFTWGYYSTKWIYSESIEDGFKAALEWKEQYLNDKYQKQEA